MGTLEAASVGEAEVCIDDWGTFFGELDNAQLGLVLMLSKHPLEEVGRESEIVAVSAERMLFWADMERDCFGLVEIWEVAYRLGILAED